MTLIEFITTQNDADFTVATGAWQTGHLHGDDWQAYRWALGSEVESEIHLCARDAVPAADDDLSFDNDGATSHITRHSPARTTREVYAIRSILESYAAIDSDNEELRAYMHEHVLRPLATIWSTDPTYLLIED